MTSLVYQRAAALVLSPHGQSMTNKTRFELKQIERWLQSYYPRDYQGQDQQNNKVENLEPLAGGYWSTAFAYSVNGEGRVLRLGASPEGYQIDRLAQEFATTALPVPEVLDVGQALDHHYAISRRHYGRFVELAPKAQSRQVCETLVRLMAAMRRTCSLATHDQTKTRVRRSYKPNVRSYPRVDALSARATGPCARRPAASERADKR